MTATTFDDDERSTSRSRPVDLYVIATPTVTYYLTSNVVDVTYAGQVYTATTMSRGSLQVAQDLTGREFIVYLPITHPIVQRYAAFGVPEQQVEITLKRLQTRSGQAIQQRNGFAQSLSMDGHVAALRVPSITDDAMKVRLPVLTAQKLCNHVLYDAQCTIDRVGATGETTITSINGNTITISVGALADPNTFTFGDLLHVASGERRMIIQHVDSVLTLNVPFVVAVVGDSLKIALGCDHSVATCLDKFNNVTNFGGHPQMDAAFNPWLPRGQGQTQQV